MWPFFHLLPSDVDDNCVPQVTKLLIKIIIRDIEIQNTFLLGNLALHMAQTLMRAAHMVVQLQKNQEAESTVLSANKALNFQISHSNAKKPEFI